MSSKVKDGTGSGFNMKIDFQKRAHTQSLSIPYEDFAVLNGDSFGILAPWREDVPREAPSAPPAVDHPDSQPIPGHAGSHHSTPTVPLHANH